MPIFRPRIAIAGGGPSGLALGLLLHRRGIDATIYELRSKPTPGELAKPSGMLDLHEESGLRAIRECGLWDGFQAAVGDCSEATRVLNPDGVVLHADEGELSYRPEIPRNALTDLLVRNLSVDTIKWNHKIAGAERSRNAATGATEITLDLGPDSGAATYDFVVGADGAWSRIRNLLSDVKPFYSGAQYVTATLRHASTRHPRLVELNGTGTLCALGGGNGLMTHRGPQDSIRVYAAVSTPDEHWATTAGLAGKTAADIKTALLGDGGPFRGWAPPLRDLLATACDEDARDNPGRAADVTPLYMLPVGHGWEHRAGATLVGDAAHLMTPWAGEGVNLALWDSLDLARVLAAVPGVADAAAWQAALEPRVREFEETMLARAAEKAEETARNKDLFLSENGAQEMADMFKRFYG
ncbi:salicylate hydroxylase [Phialemonium atrogriseum]|uniref:Salicylate hydroxylase n=1 Tax=Phialemonium atrogriseum TaxID=1093897 RepID=A0AAJ0BR68_9PEZI|nr:salicylate hydroxylase [Phialemonium atrogriseum]KAK1762542.1 salicylate hydroxylase [Phialemonium atrogriseum]